MSQGLESTKISRLRKRLELQAFGQLLRFIADCALKAPPLRLQHKPHPFWDVPQRFQDEYIDSIPLPTHIDAPKGMPDVAYCERAQQPFFLCFSLRFHGADCFVFLCFVLPKLFCDRRLVRQHQ